MKRYLCSCVLMLSMTAFGAAPAMLEKDDIPGDTPVCVTNYGPYIASGFAKLDGRTNYWNTAYGWGNHALAGYLTEYTETDSVAVPRLEKIEGRTNDWNTAYSWGNHATVGYLPKVATNGWEWGSHTSFLTLSSIGDRPSFSQTTNIIDAKIALIPAPTGVPFWYEYGNSNFFATLQGGTGYVWKVTAVASRYTVTFSADARSQLSNVYPPTTELAYPFTNGLWSGYVLSGLTNDVLYAGAGWDAARWRGVGTSYPLTLTANVNALGTAVVSNYPFHFATNLYTRLADTNELARYATLDDYVKGTNLLADQMQAIANNAAMATNRNPVYLSVGAEYPVVTTGTDSNRIVVTDSAGSAPGAWGTYTNRVSGFETNGWAWNPGDGGALLHTSFAFYDQTDIPGNWTGYGPAAPGSVHVEWYTYPVTNWSTNTVISAGKVQGAFVEGMTAAQVGALDAGATNSAGTITAGAFVGDGSGLTGLPTGSGASASTLTPLYAVATGAVTTVEWSATPRIYYIELATQTTITNSLANIGNCASNVTIEVWVNAVSSNALAVAWDSRLTWQDGAPEMTCTGLYKFVFSSACGTNIQARQTWPSRPVWQTMDVQGQTFLTGRINPVYNAGTTNLLSFQIWTKSRYVYLKNFASANRRQTIRFALTSDYNAGAFTNWPSIFDWNKPLDNGMQFIPFEGVIDGSQRYNNQIRSIFLVIRSISDEPTATCSLPVYQNDCMFRPANELEILARPNGGVLP